MKEQYTANSIKILSQEQAEGKFDWLMIENLANKHSIPQECVQRAFETAEILGVSPQYYIDRYILKLDVEEDKEFTEDSCDKLLVQLGYEKLFSLFDEFDEFEEEDENYY